MPDEKLPDCIPQEVLDKPPCPHGVSTFDSKGCMNCLLEKNEALEKELKAWKDVVDSCHWLTSNMNDAFYWACSDTGEVQADDVPKMIPLIIKHDAFTVLRAYEAII